MLIPCNRLALSVGFHVIQTISVRNERTGKKSESPKKVRLEFGSFV